MAQNLAAAQLPLARILQSCMVNAVRRFGRLGYEEHRTLPYVVSAAVDETGTVRGVRFDVKSALALAHDYWKQGYTNIRVVIGDEAYSLDQFRPLVG